MSEIEWRPVPGWDGLYQVSKEGNVKSLDRVTTNNRHIAGRVLRPYINGDGYERVNLSDAGKRYSALVHRLVMLTFVGECPEGQEVLHADGNPSNNRLSNLSYGTRSDNVQDMLKHGRNVNASKTHCKRGHAFTEENTYHPRPGRRSCKACSAMHRIQTRARAKALKDAA